MSDLVYDSPHDKPLQRIIFISFLAYIIHFCWQFWN